MLKQRQIRGDQRLFPDLTTVPVRQYTVYVREDGPAASGGRMDLPEGCWWCWEDGNVWFYADEDDYQWITLLTSRMYVLIPDGAGEYVGLHVVPKDLDAED